MPGYDYEFSLLVQDADYFIPEHGFMVFSFAWQNG